MSDTTSHALKLKFSDMPKGIANRWLAWARSHDWFADGCFDDEGDLVVRDTDSGQCFAFANPQALRDWAGY